MQQPVKQVFAHFAPNRETPRIVSARVQSALNGFADGDIFGLNLLADGDAGKILFSCRFEDISKIVVEDDFGLVDATRDDEIGVHHAFIHVDHEVGIDPKIVSALALSNGGDWRFDFPARNWARL